MEACWATGAEGVTVNSLRIQPEPAAACIFEQLTGLDVHPFVLAAGTKRKDNGEQLTKGRFA